MYDTKSILQMARGAFQERVDLEMSKVMDNILDPNTSPTQKRKLTMTIEFAPDDSRSNITVNVAVKSALAPTVPARTAYMLPERPAPARLPLWKWFRRSPVRHPWTAESRTSLPRLKLSNSRNA